jgi:hypothetical protein
MPKLSQQTLEKRFQCPHCKVTFRNRSGLSGHIQYKHPEGSTKRPDNFNDTIYDIEIMESLLKSMGKSDTEIANLTQVRKDWVLARTWMEIDNFKLSDSDFKTFQLISYAVIASEKRQKAWLTHELGETIKQLLMLNTAITENLHRQVH